MAGPGLIHLPSPSPWQVTVQVQVLVTVPGPGAGGPGVADSFKARLRGSAPDRLPGSRLERNRKSRS